MGIRLFDCHAVLGKRLQGSNLEPTSVDSLLAEMARLEIDRALVSHFSAWESESTLGNRNLAEALKQSGQLVACPIVVPDACGDVPPIQEQLRDARAVRLMPGKMKWSTSPWCAGNLLAALQERHIPAVIPYDEITPDRLHDMLAGYPDFRVILVDVFMGDNRMLLPLMQRHANLFLAVHPPFGACSAVEMFCEKVGAGQLLFGTGYPVAAPGAAVTALMYARVSSEEKALIGAANLERLLAEVESC